MLLHQDGSSHRWLPALDPELDLIVTMDDATSELYSARRSAPTTEVGAGSQARWSTRRHHEHLPGARQGDRRAGACSPEARGRSERAFGTLRDRLLKEPALAGITTVETAKRFIKEVYLPGPLSHSVPTNDETVGAMLSDTLTDRPGRLRRFKWPSLQAIKDPARGFRAFNVGP